MYHNVIPGKQKTSIESKLTRATKFLEELEELSCWMTATRELLEENEKGKEGFSVDPEVRKCSQIIALFSLIPHFKYQKRNENIRLLPLFRYCTPFLCQGETVRHEKS